MIHSNNNKIKAILFDFGGTLDTDGIHWFEKFWNVFSHFDSNITRENLRDAYLYAENEMKFRIKPEYGLLKTISSQVEFQTDYFVKENIVAIDLMDYLITSVTTKCYNDVVNTINENRELLKKLSDKYKLGLVSNYYGNVENVLSELAILDYFATVVDSKSINIYKPDERIFKTAINYLQVREEETIVIGDSYERDIIPAKKLGCKTILLLKKSWYEPADTKQADFKIDSLKELGKGVMI